MKKNLLVIGGTGFIGKNLILKFKSKNYKIFSLSKSLDNTLLSKKNITQIKCDITKKKEIEKKLKNTNFNYIINLGGYVDHRKKIKTIASHFYGVKNLVNYFKKKKIDLFIQVGTSLEYGNIKSPQSENDYKKPKSFYGIAKRNASKFIVSVNKKENFPYIILRLYQVYGPYQNYLRLLPFIIKSCLNNKNFAVTRGNQLRDFLYIDDLIDLIKKIISSKVRDQIFNVGSGKPIKVKKIIQKINCTIKKGIPEYGKIKMRKDEYLNLYPDIKKVKKYYNWKPRIKLDQGLRKTIDYYKKFI